MAQCHSESTVWWTVEQWHRVAVRVEFGETIEQWYSDSKVLWNSGIVE